MIFVDRTTVAAPAVLTVAGGKGLDEKKQAIINFQPGGPGKKFTFKAYTDDSVRDALTVLFKKKCAYCESTFVHTSFKNIEHFRPKSKIAEGVPLKPGYYWLASDWDNLFLACTLCNSQQTHAIHGSAIVESLGKMDQFPLHNFSHVRDHRIGISTEEPRRLLINPCKEDPEKFLSYGNDGNILPKGQRGLVRLKGEKSIRVYALQRIDLIDERKKVRIAIERQQQNVIDYTQYFLTFADNNPILAASFELKIDEHMDILKEFMDPNAPYSAMAKEMITNFIANQKRLLTPKVV